MKKVSLSLAAVVAMGLSAGAASAADLPAKVYKKAPVVAVVDPWDIAFGSAIMSDYVFRGITQSNHNPSVTAYFEPRYNINPNLQLYVGSSFESISFPNRAAAEVDIYGGIRPTFGALAFDIGVWGYLYPGGQCFGNGGNALLPGQFPGAGSCNGAVDFSTPNNGLPFNGNYAKRDASFYEVYGKVNYTFNDNFTLGGTAFYSPNFLNTGADGTYASIVGKYTAPAFLPWGLGTYISGEFGRQWLGTPDNFYRVLNAEFGKSGTGAYVDYNTWNVGIGFTKSVFTLDLRYSGTNLSKANCNYFTSDNTTTSTTAAGAFTSKWCGDTFIAKLGADVTLGTNIK